MYFQWTFDIQQLDYTEWKTQWQSQINFLQPVKWIFRKLNEHFQTYLLVHIIWRVREGLLEFTAQGWPGDKTTESDSFCFQAWPSHCLSQGPTKSFHVILGLSFSFICFSGWARPCVRSLLCPNCLWFKLGSMAAAFGQRAAGTQKIMAILVFWEPEWLLLE